VPEMAPTEIKALARIIDELDYYQLLHLDPKASPRDVKLAFHSTSRAFHPDANRHLDADLRTAVSDIAKRVTEAYQVLRDARRRGAYDDQLGSGGSSRIRIAEALSAGSRQDTETRQGRTPQGRQYFNLAAMDAQRGDWAAAARQLQTALTFEPDNEFFKSELKSAREKAR
jgi:DnaJ-class molecular chaperone